MSHVLCPECNLPQPKDRELTLHHQDCPRHDHRLCLLNKVGMGLTDERITYLKTHYFDPPICTPLLRWR